MRMTKLTTAAPNNRRPLTSVKDLAWALYLGPVYWLAMILPMRMVRSSRHLLPLIHLVLRPLQKRFVRNIRLYPALTDTPGGLNQLVKNCISSAFHRVLDDLLLTRFPVESVVQHCEMEGREYLEEALRLKRGVILVTGHFHATRLSRQYMKAHGWRAMSVRNFDHYDRSLGIFGEKFLQKRYYAFMHRIIEDEVNAGDKESVLKILERLRRGGIVNIHADGGKSKERCDLPFLGYTESFGLSFLQIARVAGSPLVPMECFGDSRSLKIKFYPPLFPASCENKSLMEVLVKIVESQILRHPEQWEYTIRTENTPSASNLNMMRLKGSRQ
jgi:lauroyl/myristoyl acyltransferase